MTAQNTRLRSALHCVLGRFPGAWVHPAFVDGTAHTRVRIAVTGPLRASPGCEDLRTDLRVSRPYLSLQRAELPGFGATRRTRIRTNADSPVLPGRGQRSYTIFEGTSEVQRLVIARAISGVHIR